MNINNIFYNLLDYYRSVSIAKKLISQRILTVKESQHILEKLKQHYKIQEIIDETYTSNI